jgi:phenylacetic acid degradation operon negative regulatory protein
MSASSALAPLLRHFRAEPSRTWSLIVTLYGDAVVPRGGTLWLGTLLEVCAALEIGPNAVRTAASRLAADGWLERVRVGRNAFYRLGARGQAGFAAAARRIYGADRPEWDGSFQLAVLGPAAQEADRSALEQAGFAPLAPGVLLAAVAAPGAGAAAAIRLRATTDEDSARRLARQVWLPTRLEDGYRRFLASFAPLRAALGAGLALGDLEALVARLLLVHEYRRLVLRDPMLPDALLPPDWPGLAARGLCASLYPALVAGSERWLDAHALNEGGRLPAPENDLAARFRA